MREQTAGWVGTEKAIQEITPRLAVSDNGNGDLDPQAVAELRRLARSRPTSGRAAAAKASGIRTLERLNREKWLFDPDGIRVEVLWWRRDETSG